ncbi:MAG: ABC transporter permease [Pseudomonadota bacterium]
MTAQSSASRHVLRIRPLRSMINWQELWGSRELFLFLVSRDIKTRHAQTVFGFAWVLVRPLFTVIVFAVVFGKLMKMPSDGVPYVLFSFIALAPWGYFAQAATKSADSLVAARGIISKVYYPRVLVPLTPVVAQLLDFGVSFVFALLLAGFFGYWPGSAILMAPYLVLVMMVTAVGIGLWMSALAIQYRDIGSVVPLGVQLMMYLAPVIWPLSLLEARLGSAVDIGRFLYGFYPMAGVIEGFRSAVLGSRAMPWDMLLSGSISAIAILVSGLWFFSRREPRFADVA